MSFILDALKKSEAERQRQAGPTLLEVRVAAPQRRYPLWALIVAALLAINLGVLIAFLLRAPASPPLSPTAPTASSMPPAAAAAVPAASAPPATYASAVANSTSGTAAPADIAAAPAITPNNFNSAGANPADQEPAVTADSAARSGSVTVARDTDFANLPSASEMVDVPALRLDLHVYADRAADRYALINMHKVREGDVLAEGPRVLAITREGVALEYREQRFMLRPQ